MPAYPQEKATSLSHTDKRLSPNASQTAGKMIFQGEMPADLRAEISFAADIRPYTTQTVSKMVAGMANERAFGKRYGMSRKTGPRLRFCRTASFTRPTTIMMNVIAARQ